MSLLARVLLLTVGLSLPLQAQTAPATTLPSIDVMGLPDAARAAISGAYDEARAHPDNVEPVGRLAITLHAWEQWDAAAATYRTAQTLAPKDRRWWYLHGLLETARGRHADALPLLERAVALAPDDPAGVLRVAEARMEIGDFAGSEPLLARLVREPGTLAPAEYGMGRVMMSRSDYAGALPHFTRAVSAFPDFGAAHYALALAYRRLGRAADASGEIEKQQKCVACWPAVTDRIAALIPAAREDAAATLKRGIQLAGSGDVPAAIAAHEKALALSPTLVQARVNLITLYGRAGRWSDAEAQYRAALAADRNISEAQANYAQVLLAQRRAADAVPVFRAALDSNPADGAARNGLGLALELAGDAAGALAAYRQAIVDAPTLRAARFNYGRALVTAGRPQDAIPEFERILEPEDAETPRYMFALAAARVRVGDIAAGRAQATAALSMARRYRQDDLATSIERDLATLK